MFVVYYYCKFIERLKSGHTDRSLMFVYDKICEVKSFAGKEER